MANGSPRLSTGSRCYKDGTPGKHEKVAICAFEAEAFSKLGHRASREISSSPCRVGEPSGEVEATRAVALVPRHAQPRCAAVERDADKIPPFDPGAIPPSADSKAGSGQKRFL